MRRSSGLTLKPPVLNAGANLVVRVRIAYSRCDSPAVAVLLSLFSQPRRHKQTIPRPILHIENHERRRTTAKDAWNASYHSSSSIPAHTPCPTKETVPNFPGQGGHKSKDRQDTISVANLESCNPSTIVHPFMARSNADIKDASGSFPCRLSWPGRRRSGGPGTRVGIGAFWVIQVRKRIMNSLITC